MTLTRPLTTVPLLVLAVAFCAVASAQPPKVAALEKAKARFETETAKAEEALLASLDRALAKAKNNKALTEKLTYEKDLFVRQRIVPTAISTTVYLRQRGQALNALETAYQPVLKDHLKNKREAEADALEDELSALMKAARGYGLAFPDLGSKPPVLIENKGTGMVLDAGNRTPPVQLATKAGKKKPSQCWFIEREDKGMVLRNAGNNQVLYVTRFAGADSYPLGTHRLDANKETPETSVFKFTETRRETVLSPTIKGPADTVLTVVEKKVKGVTHHELQFAAKETPIPPTQVWIITEAK